MIDLSETFKVIGPAASIIFAAWIFMGFLQQRYDAAIGRYLEKINEYKSASPTDERRRSLKISIALYKRRCNLMNAASSVGIVSAIFLISSLIIGECALILPPSAPLRSASAGAALVGLLLVIVAAIIVLIEGSIIHRQIAREVSEIDL